MVKFNSKDKSPEDIQKLLEESWMNVTFKDDTLFNPLVSIPPDSENQIHLYILYLMSRPEYVHFFCKEILNIELLPFQCVVQRELWKRKFPMLIASRGASKTFNLGLYSLIRAVLLPGRKIVICGAGFRQSKLVFEVINNIWNNAPLLRDFMGNQASNGPKFNTDTCKFTLGDSTILAIPVGSGDRIRGIRCLAPDTLIQTDDGLIEIQDYVGSDAYQLLNINKEFETPDHLFKTEKTDVYEIKTVGEYSFRCSSIHQVMTDDGWKLAKDLTKDDNLVLDNNDYFPERYISKKETVLDEDLAWLIGSLISEGTLTNRNYIHFTNTDIQFINRIKEKTNFEWIEKYREPYKDKRGFDCKGSWQLTYSNTEFRTLLKEFDVNYLMSYEKVIPSSILRSPRSVVVSFLSGLYEGDGSFFEHYESGVKRVKAVYYTASIKLAQQLQVLLLKFNIISCLQKRKSKLSKRFNYMVVCNGENAYKIYNLLDVLKWKDKLTNPSFLVKKPQIRKAKSNKYVLSTTIGNKNKYIGSFNTIDDANTAFKDYYNSNRPVVRVKSVRKLEEKQHLYDFYLPETHSFIGNGFVQHNSHDLLADEFSAHNPEIFENVIAGFGAVSSNPVRTVKQKAKENMAKILGVELIEEKDDQFVSNQLVISGTAYYHFNHFYRYWKTWKSIVLSEGKEEKLKQVFPEGVPEDFDWRDYSVMRFPVEILPYGFMDEGTIARSKATLSTGLFGMEFSAIFSEDSNGFFKASLIQSCVADDRNLIEKESEVIKFYPRIYGDPSKEYVFAIDPASEKDNFAIVILELYKDYRRIVYSWTTNSKDFKEKRKSGEIKETDFYGYCARKIRDLMKTFPCKSIAIDAAGGGKAVYESLHQKETLREGEQMIWEIIEDGKEKDSDGEEGLHIVHLVQFSKEEFTSGANHGMKKDFEDKKLLFPEYDISYLAIFNSISDDNNEAMVMEDCILEIEELKREITQIIVTSTATGRERFDTPEIKMEGSQKGHLRKDRYSALLMANWVARNMIEAQVLTFNYGGFAAANNKKDGTNFVGPAWLTKQLNSLY